MTLFRLKFIYLFPPNLNQAGPDPNLIWNYIFLVELLKKKQPELSLRLTLCTPEWPKPGQAQTTGCTLPDFHFNFLLFPPIPQLVLILGSITSVKSRRAARLNNLIPIQVSSKLDWWKSIWRPLSGPQSAEDPGIFSWWFIASWVTEHLSNWRLWRCI